MFKKHRDPRFRSIAGVPTDPADTSPGGPPATSPWAPLIAHGLTWGLLVAFLMAIVPRFQSLFADYGLDIPSAVLPILRASEALITRPVLVPLALLAFLGADAAVLSIFLRDPSGWRSAWIILGVVIPILLIAGSLVACGAMLVSLTNRIAGG